MTESAGEPVTSSAVTCPIQRDVLTVHGPDALAFLQGQLSQDVAALAPGASAPAFLLQPTGKVDAWLRVTRLAGDQPGDGPAALLLDVEPGWGEAVQARLRRFLLRTKAELDLATWAGWAVRGPGAHEAAPGGLPTVWPTNAVDLLAETPPPAPDVPQVGPEVLEALRIAAGVPRLGHEIDERTIPAELGQWVVDASVSFTKGCYTGQELVARIDSRGGNVPHPVRALRLAAPVEAGTPVTAAPVTTTSRGDELGRTTSVADHPTLGPIALAVLARSVAVGASVDVGGVAGTVAEPPLA
jgi:folate-binding protein YgfZ